MTTPLDFTEARRAYYRPRLLGLVGIMRESLLTYVVNPEAQACLICGTALRNRTGVCIRCADPYSSQRSDTVKRGRRKGMSVRLPDRPVSDREQGYGGCETCGTFYCGDGRGHTSTDVHKTASWIRYQIAAGRIVVRGAMAVILRGTLAAKTSNAETLLPHPAIALPYEAPASVLRGTDGNLLAIAEPIFRTLRETLWTREEGVAHAALLTRAVGTDKEGERDQQIVGAVSAANLLRAVTVLRTTYTKAPLDVARFVWAPVDRGYAEMYAVLRADMATVLGQHYLDVAREIWVEGAEAVLP